MIYCTKEWLTQALLSNLDKMVKVDVRAEKRDNAFYKAVKEKCYKRFMEAEQAYVDSFNPQKALERVDGLINDPNISKEERQRYVEYRETLVYLAREDVIAQDYSLDVKLVDKMFRVEVQSRIELVSKLPECILSEVADIRVLALGYVSKRVKTFLKAYCKKCRREYRETDMKARIATGIAEGYLPKPIGVRGYIDLMLQGVYRRNGDIILAFDKGKLRVVNGQIVKRERARLYHYKEEELYSPWSMVIRTEVGYENGIFTIHFLIDNKDRMEKSIYWELIVSGTSIVECRGSRLSEAYEILRLLKRG